MEIVTLGNWHVEVSQDERKAMCTVTNIRVRGACVASLDRANATRLRDRLNEVLGET